jgi:hypothetical protein
MGKFSLHVPSRLRLDPPNIQPSGYFGEGGYGRDGESFPRKENILNVHEQIAHVHP